MILQDVNGAEFTFSNGETLTLKETQAPEDYYSMDAVIQLSAADNKVFINGSELTEDGTITADEESPPEHGSWMAKLSEDVVTIKVYDEPMPPTWKLTGRKYGTQVIEALALAGAKFTLWKQETALDGSRTETEVISVTSSDETDGKSKGMLLFVDSGGLPLALDCDATYILRETYAPMGYDLTEDIVIQVNQDGSQVTVLQNNEAYTGASYDAAEKTLTLSIVDDAVYHLPETGGRGIYPYILTGIWMMCFSAVFLALLSHKGCRERTKESKNRN
jgi:hypothetical protein